MTGGPSVAGFGLAPYPLAFYTGGNFPSLPHVVVVPVESNPPLPKGPCTCFGCLLPFFVDNVFVAGYPYNQVGIPS